nr:MAG TPA: hypothetical protein [Caudoviricetes sp.]
MPEEVYLSVATRTGASFSSLQGRTYSQAKPA